jgi:hypothetical protein
VSADAITLVNHLVHVGGDLGLLRRIQTHLLEAYREEQGHTHTAFYQDTRDDQYARLKTKKRLTAKKREV